MSESDDHISAVPYFVVIIFFLGMIGPTLSAPPSGTIVNPFTCKVIEGSIIDKRDDEEGYRLYVELFVKDEWEGHIVWVSNKTYQTYEIGYTYEQMICELIEYENILETYDDMIDSGWLTPSRIPTIST